MTKFEVGKSYALHLPAKYDGKATFITDIYTVTKRTPCYLTFSHISHDGTKMPHCRCKIFTSDSRGEFVHATAFFCLYADSHIDDDSQPELPATAYDAISATDNDSALASQPAAVATAECETPAQPEIVKFIIGKTYKCVFSQRVRSWGEEHSHMKHYHYKFTIIARNGRFITVRDEDNGETAKRLLNVDNNNVEYIKPKGTYASHNRFVLFANDPTVEPEISMPAKITQSEISQPDALYDDDSFSDAPGDNSECARNQDFPVDIPECTHAEITQQVLPAPVDNNPLHHLKPCPACHSTHIPFLKRCDNNNFKTATRRFNGGIARQHIYYRLKCRDCGHEVTATVYRSCGDGFVIPHQNEADVKKKVLQDWDLQYTENPGFTIVPSEHIERPQYTAYPDTITDECPYVTVYACDIPENHSSAAVVPYADFAHIRNFFRLIALYLRLWLAMNITPNKNPLDDFPDGLFTHYATRKKPRAKFRRAVFEVGSSYSASSYSTSKGLQSFTFLVTGRCIYEDTYNKRKNVMLFITCNNPDNHDFEGRGVIRFIDTDHGVEVYNHRTYYEMGCGWRVFSFRADKRDNIPFPFTNTTPGDPNYKPCGNATRFLSREFLNYSDNPDAVKEIPAEINDITPETKAQPKTRKHNPAPASDIEHKLIDTKDLHFAEKRKALEHNATVITSCMFPEAVIYLLLSISAKAVIQLGFHMGLFVAKPKGSKIAIAESFAQRLITRRDIHANVRTMSANTDAKNTANVPDGVKIFIGARRQICFKFED